MTKQPTAKKPRLHNFLLPPGQRSIIESLTTVDHSRAVRALARAFAFSSIAYSVVQTEEFREFLRYTGWPADRPITRQALKGEDFQLFHFIASEDEKKECAEILQQHEQQNSEEMIDVEEEEEKQEPEARAAAVASASSRRRLRRDQSEIFSDLSGFIDWFILDAGLTASTGWNSDLRCRLDAASRKLVNSPVLSKLEETVRARLSH
jgi:hypothetical protein